MYTWYISTCMFTTYTILIGRQCRQPYQIDVAVMVMVVVRGIHRVTASHFE